MDWEHRKESHDYDKSAWSPGPWQVEPDRVEWRYLGLPCLIVRTEHTGGLCGYVGVPPGHPAREAGDEAFDVHGGLTYGAPCDENGKICHVPLPGEPADVHWLGFDCAHAGDLIPNLGLGMGISFNGDVYRDVAFVRAQVERLADQVSKFEKRS